MSTTGSLKSTVGTLNPIRYRGYYYDVETGLYYLQSRYYDPEIGRFISPDVVAEGGNLYTYCVNDPVNRSDESGYLSKTWKNVIKVAIGVVATVAAVAITVATGGAALPVIASVAVSTVIGAGISAGITALQGGSGEAILDAAIDGAIDGFMWGGISALASASISAIRAGATATKATASQAIKTTSGTGYDSYAAFKKAQGAAGPGKEWHHIVEQCQIGKSGFSPQQIHNTNNMVALDKSVHRQISSYYSSIKKFTDNQTVRNWLVGQSFEEQTKFGQYVIKIFLG